MEAGRRIKGRRQQPHRARSRRRRVTARTVRRLGVALAALVVSSCIPVPHYAFRTPIIHGMLIDETQSAVGTVVRVVADPAQDPPCAGRHSSDTRTDASGNFRFCPMPDFQMSMVMMAHSRFRWNVCASIQGKWILLQQSERYTLSDAGPREIERIECRVDAASPQCNRSTDIDVTPEEIRAALGSARCVGFPIRD